jgi:cytochrome oxidase assembly protein ShyY1
VLRTALKPRWLALLALALVLATGMAFLGQWQLDRAREHSHARAIEVAASRPAVELPSLLRPRQSFTTGAADRPVTVSGTWDRTHQLLVADRYLSGAKGWWILTPLMLADGSAVPVVRGWVASTTDPVVTLQTPGTVRVAGVLRPSEPPIDREPGRTSGLPEGQLDGVDLTELVQLWPFRMITGYVVMTAEEPSRSAAPVLVPPTAPSNRSVAWQNLSYALQWFVFAGFGLFMWWRLVRDDHRGVLRRAAAEAAPKPAPAGDPAGDTEPAPARDRSGEPVSDRGAQQ